MDRATVTQVLADRLRRLRAERGWSAQQLADECARAGFGSLTRSTIAKIESGTRKSVTADEVAALAHVLDVTPTDLLASPARSEVVHRTIMVVDIVGVPSPLDMYSGRRTLVELLRTASADTGIDFADATVVHEDDAALIVLPPETSKNELAGQFPNALAAALRRHNATRDAAEHVQLRLVLHAGDVRRDDRGVAGAAVIQAYRLLRAPEAKSVLRLTPSVLALITSDDFYEDVVRHDPGAEPELFRRIEVKNPRTNAWLRLFDEVRSASQPRRRDVPAVWGGVPLRNPNFIGRATLLDELEDRLTDERATVVVSAALHGLGGIGKSQLAIEYVYRHLDRYDLVWWIPAWEPAQIRASLTELARQLRLPGEADNPVHAVLEALRLGEPYGRWLLIFDSADGPEAVEPFLPANGPGEVLITSRSPHWAGVAQPLDVPVFTRDESIELMRRRGLAIDDVAEADRLAEHLGDLPLAIEQATAWQVETGMPVDEYLRLFNEQVTEILDVSKPARYEITVAAAWNVSFDSLRDSNPGAHQLLEVCAFFASGRISRAMLTGVRGASVPPELGKVVQDPLQLARAVRDINRRGLAKINNRDGTLQLHRLVRLVLRNRMSPSVREEARHAAHVLLANFDPDTPTAPRNWPRYRELLAHARESDAVRSEDAWVRRLVINLVRFLYSCGEHEQAATLAGLAHEKWSEQSGDGDRNALVAATLRGLSLHALGRFTDAANLNRRTLELCGRALGEGSEEAVQAELLTVLDLVAAGEFRRALEVCEGSHHKAANLFGANDPFTLQAAHQLGFVLRLCGDYRRALELDEGTLRARGDVLGQDTVDTLNSWTALILDRRELGEYEVAHQLLERAAAQMIDLAGEDALWQLAELSVAKRSIGDHVGALRLSEVVLDSAHQRYDADHPRVVAGTLTHSINLRHAGELAEARELGTTAVTGYRRLFGERHPHTLAAEGNLAIAVRLTGDAELARQQHEQALHGLRAALGGEHPHVIACGLNLAGDLAALGEDETANAVWVEWMPRAQRVSFEGPTVDLAVDIDLPSLS